MKVILTQDVPNLGSKNQIKDVSDGHATNFLLPRGMVKLATPKAVKEAEMEKNRIEAERKIREDLLLKNIKEIEGIVVSVSLKANEKGHLFAGLHKAEIADLVKNQTRLDIIPDNIALDSPIKEVGEYTVTVAVQDKKAIFKLNITPKAD